MIKLKVINVGNALGVVLPKAALERLRVVKGDILALTSGVDGMHVLGPDNTAMTRELEVAEQEIARFKDAMRALAKK